MPTNDADVFEESYLLKMMDLPVSTEAVESIEVPQIVEGCESGLEMSPAPTFLPLVQEHHVTLMMRNLPNRYTQQMVLEEIHEAGFEGQYDFFYLPIDSVRGSNRGFAFINFTEVAFAAEFKMAFEGRQMRKFNSTKRIAIVPAALQGLKANYEHYSDKLVNLKDPFARPLFLKDPDGNEMPGIAELLPQLPTVHGGESNGPADDQGPLPFESLDWLSQAEVQKVPSTLLWLQPSEVWQMDNTSDVDFHSTDSMSMANTEAQTATTEYTILGHFSC